jgi:hypothetical protein
VCVAPGASQLRELAHEVQRALITPSLASYCDLGATRKDEEPDALAVQACDGLSLRVQRQLMSELGKNCSALFCEPFHVKPREKEKMKKYLMAAVLISAFTMPAFAAMMPGSGPYYVGLDSATHKCSVVHSMSAGMKRMGKFKTQAAAHRAMSHMKQCSA